jgi:sigma-E factor negative regulatory protein RseC
MFNEGRVLKTDGKFANVQIFREGACTHDCKNCAGCGPDNKSTIIAINEIEAKPGDFVEIKGDGKIIYRAFLIYFVPILLFFTGYLTGFLLNFSEEIRIGLGILFFILSILLNIFVSRSEKRKGKIPKIIKIL